MGHDYFVGQTPEASISFICIGTYAPLRKYMHNFCTLSLSRGRVDEPKPRKVWGFANDFQNILAGASCEYLLFKTGGTRFIAMVKVTDIVTGEVEMQGGSDLNQFEREYRCLGEMKVWIYSPICSQHFPLFRQAMPRYFTCTICQLSKFTKTSRATFANFLGLLRLRVHHLPTF